MTDISNDIKNRTLIIEGLTYEKNKYSLSRDITWTGTDNDRYILLQDNETFDGENHTITIGGNSFTHGIFASNGTSSVNGPVIKKLKVSGVIIQPNNNTGGGGIMRYGQKYFTIKHCSTDGTISENCGGISGSHTGLGGKCLIYKCSSSGPIGSYGGGIVGTCSSATDECICTIYECFSSGFINGFGGGICGSNAGYGISSSVNNYTIYNCYSTGIISGYGGGICGVNAGCPGSCTIYNCYSVGNIGTLPFGSAGGICGRCTDSGGSLSISTCYSLGNMIGIFFNNTGGIIGRIIATNFVVNITDCYSIGNMSQYSFGICASLGNSTATVNITRCFTTGYSHFQNIGTIISYNVGALTLRDCYSYRFNNSNTLDLSNIFEKKLGVFSRSLWDKSTDKLYPYPKLKAFRVHPWKSSSYKNYTQQAEFELE